MWWRITKNTRKPAHIERYLNMPRMLLDRDIYKLPFSFGRNLPDLTRWEHLINGTRVSSDRTHLVEEDGMRYSVNWRLYSDRVNAELQQAVDSQPCFTFFMAAAPFKWKGMDVAAARIRNLSLREAMAQCKLSPLKGHLILYKCLERAQQGAEGKGLDKERLRVARVVIKKGPTDKQADMKSKGYFAWKTKKASHILVTLLEDPELQLPDRSMLPHESRVSLRRAGILTEPTVLDIPAITAEGI
jgi:ribosomal protein L22